MNLRACILPTLLFLFSTALHAQDDVLSRRISVNYYNTPLEDVLHGLEERAGCIFVYGQQHLPLSQQISLHARRRPLKQVLAQLCEASGIEYRLIGGQIALRAAPRPKREPSFAKAREPLSQTVRGQVLDEASRMPLIGANIQLLDSAQFLGASTDANGEFHLPNVPLGRHNFLVTYLGYEPLTVRDLLLVSGKEMVLEIELQESTTTLDEVVVTTAIDKMQPLNDMITLSGRQFRVEEASRYPGSFQDPARMSRTFAGVSYVSDLENDLIIRGNAPTSLLWRLEGIEIPTPNHFSSIGSTGGAISMLNSNILTTSDFLTSAFPAEYGNSVSGVFDLKFRNGNTEKREYTLSAGVLGLEAGIEGPIDKDKGSSFLLNYRYSTLDILDRMGLNPAFDFGVPRYQDLAFKLFLPTPKAGVFSIFGLTATNDIGRSPQPVPGGDYDSPIFSREANRYGVLGIKHSYQLSPSSYLQSVAALAYERYRYDFEYFNDSTEIDLKDVIVDEREKHLNATLRLSVQYNRKRDAAHTTQLGLILSQHLYDFNYRFNNNRLGLSGVFLDDAGSATTLQAYAQWKHRFSDRWTLKHGLHLLYFSLNEAFTLEPRLGLDYQLSPRESLRFGLGLHSYIGHLSSYLFHDPFDFDVQPFRHRQLPKSLQAVAGYSIELASDWHLRPEIYYQYLFDAAVSSDPSISWISVLNVLNNYDVFDSAEMPITNKGKGRNMGFELTAEKLFSQGYYCLFTASIYDSRYSTADGTWYSTRFNGNYIFNLLGGREFNIEKNHTIGLNAKLIYAGGNRYSLINEEASRGRGFTVIYPEFVNSEKGPNYHRVDLLLSYTANRPEATHRFSLDIQNLFNRRNVLEYYFDAGADEIVTDYQVELLFDLRYRLVF